MRYTVNPNATIFVHANRQDRTNVVDVAVLREHLPLRMRLDARRSLRGSAALFLAGSKSGYQPQPAGRIPEQQPSCSAASGKVRCRQWRPVGSPVFAKIG